MSDELRTALAEVETVASQVHDDIWAEPFDEARRKLASDGIWRVHQIVRPLLVSDGPNAEGRCPVHRHPSRHGPACGRPITHRALAPWGGVDICDLCAEDYRRSSVPWTVVPLATDASA